MSFKLNGNEINVAKGNVVINGVDVDKLILNGVLVWSVWDGPDGPLVITSNTTLTAGVDFPAYENISICAVGGGGSGAAATINEVYAGGGHSGQVVNTTRSFEYGESVSITIGSGGSSVTNGSNIIDVPGNPGGNTTVYNITASGGAGGDPGGAYQGNNGVRTTCLGTANDGLLDSDTSTDNVFGWGGQSSGYSDGGDGAVNVNGDATASAGGRGSGGGGASVGGTDPTLTATSGAGGAGVVILDW